MKKLAFVFTAILLALLIAGTLPAQVFADARPEYISDVRIGMGKKAADAEAALDGYTILTDEKGNKVDLNQKAGGGWGSKGDKVVYLGYTTTTDRRLAITDLALMNMQGGYKVEDYEALMEMQMRAQIIPFVDDFVATINEYRTNYASDIERNKSKADFVHDTLNKLTDDDTGKQLGDLFLNKTKYELGDDAYNKLSAEEQKNHADILTIIAQANGPATLLIFRLLSMAADTHEDSWLDRFSAITYDDLVASLDMLPSDADARLARLYDDTASKILEVWDTFRNQLLGADEAEDVLEEMTDEGIDQNQYTELFENFDLATATEEEMETYAEAIAEATATSQKLSNNLTDFAAKEYLDSIAYGDGTMYDFFTQTSEEISADITVLYPLVASLTPGQIAGLDYVSLSDLVAIAGTDSYADITLEDIDETSIYFGVDRDIYAKNGVALTSDSLRKDAADVAQEFGNPLGTLTWIMVGLTAAAALGLAGSLVAKAVNFRQLKALDLARETFYAQRVEISTTYSHAERMIKELEDLRLEKGSLTGSEEGQLTFFKNRKSQCESKINGEYATFNQSDDLERAMNRSTLTSKLAIGFSVAMVILGAITTYLSYRDLVEYYNVDFVEIPHYMVDEKDITAYRADGTKIVLKNQSAYYKAAQCNRKQGDEFYDKLGTSADMNGDVGRQWLALYVQKSDVFPPILADSLLVKVNDGAVPAGYTTGIHMFGAETAFNLNNELYDWNKDAPSVYVYFKTVVGQTASTSGSAFTAGNLALTGVGGLAVGAVAAAIITTMIGKKKKNAA